MRRIMKLSKKTFRIIAIYMTIIILLSAMLASSCGKTEPEPPTSTMPSTTEATKAVELHHGTLFNILSSENGYKTNISLDRVREFYASGIPKDLYSKFNSEQSVVNLNLTASAGVCVFEAGAEYTDFILNLLKDASLSLEIKRDPRRKSSAANAAISLSGQKLAGADIAVSEGEHFAFRSQELYPKYIALDYPDLMGIIAGAADNPSIGQISYDNLSSLQDKYFKLLTLADIEKERADAVVKPFIEKLKDVIAEENITAEKAAAADGVPGDAMKKYSVSLASDDLRRVLTALMQAAKENAALHALIKEKYAIIYDCITEMTELGVSVDPAFSGFPPVESIEGVIQSTFAGFEVMLGSVAGLPVKAVKIDLYVDGTLLKCVNVQAWTKLPEPVQAANAGGGAGNAGGNAAANAGGGAGNIVSNAGPGATPVDVALPSSVEIIDGAGDPAVQIWLKSYDAENQRNDSLEAYYINDLGEKNEFSVTSALAAGQKGGDNKIEAIFGGPAFDGRFVNASLDYSWNETDKTLLLNTRYSGEPDDANRLTRLFLSLKAGADGGYELASELDMNDPDAVRRQMESGEAGSGSCPDYAIGVKCNGTLKFAQVELPGIPDGDVQKLVEDSFYDGTFEKIFNEFYANLILFASANRQLLSLYGFPGF